MQFHTLIALAVAGLFLASAAAAQMLPPGPQVLTFFSDVDDTEQPYALYLPLNFDSSKRYPLVVSLHGAGSNHRLNLRRVFGKSNAPGENDVEASLYFPEWEDVDYIVASPYARGTMGYQGVAEKDVMDMLADVKRRFPIDEDRMYLTGLSMGGGGTMWIGFTQPDLWAAVAPVCPAPPQGTEAMAVNALNLPVHIFHGDADPVVRVEGVRAWVDRLRGAGAEVEYTEYPGVSHDSWVNAYADGQIFEWFGQHRRNPYPDRVRFTTDRYKYDGAYWVYVDGLTPGVHAEIDAHFTADNRIEIETSDLDGFTLRPSGHPRYKAGSSVDVTIDGASLSVPAGGELSFSRRSGSWVAAQYMPGADDKQAGAEGPMGDALSARHIYVYGTAGDPTPEEVAARQKLAETAATWSVYRGAFMNRVMVFPRVVADRDVRPSDLESSNLVLFGTRTTNGLIDRLGDRLPLHLEESAGEDLGLVYIYPVDGHYVIVSSGLPWWTAPPEDARQGSPFSGQVPALGLMGSDDFILFRGWTGNPIAKGRFDLDWGVPHELRTAIP